MSILEITPGPWRLGPQGIPSSTLPGSVLPIRRPDGTVIAVITEGGLADGQLMAAAREMLTALQAVSDWHGGAELNRAYVMRDARKAIAKATGQEDE